MNWRQKTSRAATAEPQRTEAAGVSTSDPRALHPRTRLAAIVLIVAAVLSLAAVVQHPWSISADLRHWPTDEIFLAACSIVMPLLLGLLWWPRRLAVDEALARRPDSEHEQATIRMALGGVALLYLSGAEFVFEAHEGLHRAATAMAWGMCVGWLALAHIILWPGQSTIRRCFMNMVDLLVLSYMLASGGAVASVLFLIYLWVTFGNGFRYGVGFLAFSAGVSAVGFTGTILTSDYWAANSYMAYGLLASLLVLPAYVSTLIRKLNRAKAQAEEASQAKSRFLATMSHELRTPLTAVISTGDLLETTSLDVEQRNMVGTVQASAKALLSLINEILDLSRIEAGKQNLDIGDLDISEIVAGVAKMLRTQAEKKGLRLRVILDAALEPRLRGDTKRLMQILVNLTGNAIKFTEQGEVEISATLVERTDGRHLVLFTVRDTGIGVPAGKLDSIFEGFTQADDAINRRYGGTGLGLTITKQLVEMMGGRIEVQSEEGRGSEFRLTVPLEADGEEVSPDTPMEAGRTGRIPLVLFSQSDLSGALGGIAGSAKIREAASLEQAAAAVQDLRPEGQTVVVVDDCRESPQANEFLRFLSDSDIREGITVLELRATELMPGPMSEPIARWPVDLTIAAPGNAAAVQQALRQVGLFYASAGAGGQDVAQGVQEGAAAAQPGRRVLLVDDNRTNRQVISRVLENAGHSVLTAENGDDALDRLDSESFDIVLTDINMPGTSGLDLTKMYRVLHADAPHLPIVALTADATEQAKRDCAEAGMDGYLTKPVEAQQLLALIRKLTARPEEAAVAVPAAAGPAPEAVSRREQARHAAPDRGARPVTRVTPISSHPKYGSLSDPVIDPDALDALRALDEDAGFAAEVYRDFLADTGLTLDRLETTFAQGDLAGFHDEAHALRSSAGYVGARRLVRLLLDMRELGPDKDNAKTRERLAELRAEFELLRGAVAQAFSEESGETGPERSDTGYTDRRLPNDL